MHHFLIKWLYTAIFEFIDVVLLKAVLLLTSAHVFCKGVAVVNDRPIIGILSQEQSKYLQSKFVEEKYTSYIGASFVKDVEASGARVVPIMIGKTRDYYEDLMQKINGVLFPGGATYFNQSNGFADAGQYIYEIAIQMNDAGDYFPIFGTCLGLELLIVLASGRESDENRVPCYSYRSMPLEFVRDFRSSKMYMDAPSDIIKILSTENVTVNAHQFCIIDDNLQSHNLTKYWRITSYSKDDRGTYFIASIENNRYPFYGVQFHPEKSAFEWKISKSYPHTATAIKANRYFMDFFVNECRKSNHSFSNCMEENNYLIYNYIPVFVAPLGSAYQQCYFFEPQGVVSKRTLHEKIS